MHCPLPDEPSHSKHQRSVEIVARTRKGGRSDEKRTSRRSDRDVNTTTGQTQGVLQFCPACHNVGTGALPFMCLIDACFTRRVVGLVGDGLPRAWETTMT